MSKSSAIYVGMDVHKDSIDIALAAGGARGEVRHYGTIGGGMTECGRERPILAAGEVRRRFAGTPNNTGELARSGKKKPQPRTVGVLLLVRPAGRTYLEVKVLYSPDKGKS